MDNGLCLYVNLITFILSLIFGFWKGVVHDRKKRRAKAYLSIYSPLGNDSINGLIIENNTGVVATDIHIRIWERKKIFQRLFSRDVLQTQKTIVLLRDTESSSIFDDNCDINRNDFSKIKVEVKYRSIKFEEEIDMTKSFNRI
ncbi:hypothetical protein PGTDC60_1047 [Porphyromonas gingivalis TDC60]|uniref:hypothetical protein n=1 Tax=Porphyromonas gingivalis TaxID=837 RepID=UPI00020EFFAD|nr:hypothetical protein [Porphyromonas gingivalis]ATS01186.1 hypothetical protein CS549_09050 [Porphyromonas gingivalis]BAK25204.1 hypothetical protein PGTDC60_1047 [Porphyromonas gingivalis TDC60]